MKTKKTKKQDKFLCPKCKFEMGIATLIDDLSTQLLGMKSFVFVCINKKCELEGLLRVY